MIFDIVQVGDPVLRRPAQPLSREEIATPFVQELIVKYSSLEHASSVEEIRHPLIREAWDALATMPEAAYVGLVVPRFMLRNPYGDRTDPITRRF